MKHRIKVINNPTGTWAQVFLDNFEVIGLLGVTVDIQHKDVPVVTLRISGYIETETMEKPEDNGR